LAPIILTSFSIHCATSKNPDFKGFLRDFGPKGGKTCHARQDEFAPAAAPAKLAKILCQPVSRRFGKKLFQRNGLTHHTKYSIH
jgi:hypothetical protein